MSKKINVRVGVICAMIAGAALGRLALTGIPNFSPIGGIALFGAAYFSRKYLAFIVPLVTMYITDLVINNMIYPRMFPEYYDGAFAWGISPWVYGTFALIVLLGFGLLKKVSAPRLLTASLSASVLFFIVTNFAVWAGGVTYPKTVEGLIACYTAAIPFFQNTLLGDLFFVGVLFGAYELLKQGIPALKLQKS